MDKRLLDSVPGAVRAARPWHEQDAAQTFGSSAMKQVPCRQFSHGLPVKPVMTKTNLY